MAPPAGISGAGPLPVSEKLEEWGLLPKDPDWASHFGKVWSPGEDGARARLQHFVEHGLQDYTSGRDFPARDATSGLSPHLAHGEITPAQAWYAARSASDADPAQITHFRRELAWRDFNYSLLVEFPNLARDNWNSEFDPFDWSFEGALFRAWTTGRTGYPIVDAGCASSGRKAICTIASG